MALDLPFGFYFGFYNLGINIISPFARGILSKRIKAGKEDANRVEERFGISEFARPEIPNGGKLIWFHGASVGETAIGLGIADSLRQKDPKLRFLFTSQTMTAANIIAKRMGKGDVHQYFPLDKKEYVKKFLDYWQPNAAIFLEGEIWVNMLMELSNREIPHFLLNARMTAKTINNWLKYKAVSCKLFSEFEYAHAANAIVAEALGEFGYKGKVKCGNLKTASKPLAINDDEVAQLKNTIGNRKVWLAASTHDGEDELVLKAQEILKISNTNALLIIAPRHIERTETIILQAQKLGLKVARRNNHQSPNEDIDVYLWDTMGELGNAFKISEVSLICGSLVAGIGGHNPIEPAQINSAIISGGYVHNFADIYNDMELAQAAIIINHPTERDIALNISSLLFNDDQRGEMITNAANYLLDNQEIYHNVVKDIFELIEIKS